MVLVTKRVLLEMSPSRLPHRLQWDVLVYEQVCLGSVISGEWAVGMSAWVTLWWGRSESNFLPLFSQPIDICPSGGPSPLLRWKEASPSCTPTALLPPSLFFLPPWPACLLTGGCVLSTPLLGRPPPRPSNLHVPLMQWLFCVAWTPLPSSPAGPTPSRSCAGGLGGRGIMNPQGGGGQGNYFPVSCFY